MGVGRRRPPGQIWDVCRARPAIAMHEGLVSYSTALTTTAATVRWTATDRARPALHKQYVMKQCKEAKGNAIVSTGTMPNYHPAMLTTHHAQSHAREIDRVRLQASLLFSTHTATKDEHKEITTRAGQAANTATTTQHATLSKLFFPTTLRLQGGESQHRASARTGHDGPSSFMWCAAHKTFTSSASPPSPRRPESTTALSFPLPPTTHTHNSSNPSNTSTTFKPGMLTEGEVWQLSSGSNSRLGWYRNGVGTWDMDVL